MLSPSQVNLKFKILHPILRKTILEQLLEIPPTNMSATVKFITKYILRERRFLFFIKMMIDRRFTVTIATDTVRNAANQVMHSGEENMVDCLLSTF